MDLFELATQNARDEFDHLRDIQAQRNKLESMTHELIIVVRALHVTCAWCGIVLQEGDQSKPHSHGICPTCFKREFGDA